MSELPHTSAAVAQLAVIARIMMLVSREERLMGHVSSLALWQVYRPARTGKRDLGKSTVVA